MCSDRRAALGGLAAALALAGCGFEPLYAPAGPAAAAAGRVSVAVIPGTVGFAMRERLVERLGPEAAPTHRLAVALDLRTEGIALTQRDVTNRFDVIAVATWSLTPLGDDRPALRGTERATTGYSAPAKDTASAFAILAAERDAERRAALVLAERIAARIALAAPDWAA